MPSHSCSQEMDDDTVSGLAKGDTAVAVQILVKSGCFNTGSAVKFLGAFAAASSALAGGGAAVGGGGGIAATSSAMASLSLTSARCNHLQPLLQTEYFPYPSKHNR